MNQQRAETKKIQAQANKVSWEILRSIFMMMRRRTPTTAAPPPPTPPPLTTTMDDDDDEGDGGCDGGGGGFYSHIHPWSQCWWVACYMVRPFALSDSFCCGWIVRHAGFAIALGTGSNQMGVMMVIVMVPVLVMMKKMKIPKKGLPSLTVIWEVLHYLNDYV